MKVTDEMVKEAHEKLLPVTVAVFGEGYLKHVIKHALNAALAVAPQDDIPPHKSLNERVAKLEQQVQAMADGNVALALQVLGTEQKIDTHIHHVDGLVTSTGTAIYPVGRTKDDDARWEQVALAARQQGMGTYYTSNFHALPIVKAAVDKAVELGLVSRREDG